MRIIFLVLCLLKESFAQIEEFSEGLCKFGEDDLILWGLQYVQCLDECRARDLCTSVNANLGVAQCRLNFDSTIPEVPCDFYILSEKSDWKKKRLCYEDVKCSDEINVKTTAKCECTIEECLPLTVPDNGVLMGTGRLVGHRVVVGCKNERDVITEYHQRNCITKGIWSGETVVCPGTSGPKSDPITETVQTMRTTTTTTTEAATTDMATTTTTISTTAAVTNATVPTTTTPTTAAATTTPSSTTQTANETATVENDQTTEPQNTPDQHSTTNTHLTEPPDTLDDMSTTNTQTTRSPDSPDDMSTIKTQSTTLEPPTTEKIITAPVTTRQGTSSLSSTATTTTTTTSTASRTTTTTTTSTTTSTATTSEADYFMVRYNQSCDSSTIANTYNWCDPEFGLECRLERCQCMPPRVLDPVGHACVTTCPATHLVDQTYGSTYQEYDHFDLIPADAMTSTESILHYRSGGVLPTTEMIESITRCNRDETCRAVHLYIAGESGTLTIYHGPGDIQIIPTVISADYMRLYVRDCIVQDPTGLS